MHISLSEREESFRIMSDMVFFSSPIGLGHATRDVAIAQNLQDIPMKFISGGPGPKLISQFGFKVEDKYKPPSFNIENGKLSKPLSWLWKYYSYYRECKKISSQIITDDAPKVVVSDEDFASLVVAQNIGTRTILITDILETNFAKGIGSVIEKQMNKSMRNIIKKCDLVILPEMGEDHDNIKRVGPIVRDTSQSREQLRKKFSFDKKTIVVSIGGTDAGKFLIEKTVEAYLKINLDADLVIVSGPSLDFKHPKIRNLGFVNNMHEVIFASDLIISLAGKSTIDESKHYGTPGIFIPIKGHFEQEDNARESGYVYDDVFCLEKLIPQKIEQRREPMPFYGAKKASELIRKFLD